MSIPRCPSKKIRDAGLRTNPESDTHNFHQLHAEFRDKLIKNKNKYKNINFLFKKIKKGVPKS